MAAKASVTGQIAVADIGGTRARFALAELIDGAVANLGDPVVLKTDDFDGFEDAWAEFSRMIGRLPDAAAIAIAGPVTGDRVPMTNGRWVLSIARLKSTLGVEALTVLNDFGAVAHAVAKLPGGKFAHLTGPERPLPEEGTISVIGPGTGLGVAQLHRFAGGYRVQASEGGHVGFAPQDEIDDRIVASLRARSGRVVNEHVVAGQGIVAIHAALGGGGLDAREIWRRGIAGEDGLAARAVGRFCASLGGVVGDYALTHGASAVVLAGGIVQNLGHLLPASQFGDRFRAKPHYQAMMADIPVKLITHPQPGLYGAAVAFAQEHG